MIDIEEIKSIVLDAGTIFFDRVAAARQKEKGNADFVTDVDFAVQEYIYAKLIEKFPDYQFMGEEKSNEEIDENGTFWVLDPVDGTTNLIHDYQNSAISLALVTKGEVVLGIVYNPFHKEMFWAKKGEGCYLNSVQVHVSDAKDLSESLISIGTSPYYKEMAEENFHIFREIFLASQDIRRCGAASLDMAYVACGRIEAYMERKLKLWDYAAGRLLIEEAGGVVVNYKGENIDIDYEADILAGNDAITQIIVERYLSNEN